MSTFARQQRCWFLSLLLIWSLGHASVRGGDDTSADNPADKIRKALDQVVTLDHTTPSFNDLVQHLKDKTSVNFTLDAFTLQQMGLSLDEGPTPLRLKADRVKLRQAVQRLLNPFNLTFVIVEDTVLITTEEMGLARQMRQRVNVQVDDLPLNKALKDLSRSTALNLVVDPRHSKELQNPVSLKLEDASLETAVRLLAELGGLKAVRMGNALFVTSEARATKIRKEEPPPMNVIPDLVFPGNGPGLVPGGAAAGIGVPPLIPQPPGCERNTK